MVKNLPANAEDPGSVPGLGWFLGGGNGNPLQCSCHENPMDWGAWWATVLRVTKSWTQPCTHISAPNSLRFPTMSSQKTLTKWDFRMARRGEENTENTHTHTHTHTPLLTDPPLLSSILLSRGGSWGNTLASPTLPCLSHIQTRLWPGCTTKIQLAPQVKKGSLWTQRDLSKAIIFLLSRMLAIFNPAGKHSYASSERQIPEW